MTQDNFTEAAARVIDRNGNEQRFDLGLDPAAAEAVGERVAGELSDVSPTVVLCLEHEEDAVLAHIVARRLGATRVVLREQEGLLWFSHDIKAGSRVVAVAAHPDRVKPNEVLREMLQHSGAALVGVMRLVPADELSARDWVVRDAER